MALKRRTSLKFSSENGDVPAVAENQPQAATPTEQTPPPSAPELPSEELAAAPEAMAPQTEETSAEPPAIDQPVLDNISRQVAEQMAEEDTTEELPPEPEVSEQKIEPEPLPAIEESQEPTLPEGMDLKPDSEPQEEVAEAPKEEPKRRSGLDDFLEDDQPKSAEASKEEKQEEEQEKSEEPKSRADRAGDRLKSAMSSLVDDESDIDDLMPGNVGNTPPPTPVPEQEKPVETALAEDDLPPPPEGTVAPMPPMTDAEDDEDDDDLDDLPPPPWEAITEPLGSTLPPSVESLMGDDKDDEPEAPQPAAPAVEPLAATPSAEIPAAIPEQPAAPAPQPAPAAAPTDDWDIADLIDFAPKPGAEPQPAPTSSVAPPPTGAGTPPPPPQAPVANAPSAGQSGGPSTPPKAPPGPQAGQAPWATPSYDPPPELPGDDLSTRKSSPNAPKPTRSSDSALMRNIMVFGLAGIVIFGAYLMFFKNSEKTNERLARITGTLNEVSQEIPTEENAGQLDGFGIRAEQQVPMPDLDRAANDDTQIEFLEPPEVADNVNDAAGEEKVDKSLFTSLQDAIMKAREQKRQTDSAKLNTEEETLDPTLMSREQRVARDQEIRQQLEDELAAYRRALTETPNPALRPGPDEFFNSRENGTLQPPSSALQADSNPSDSALAPNPNNLPVIAPPQMPDQGQLGVRTLNDFDVSMFEPPRARVRMPEQVRPRINPLSFPKVVLLSLVPNRGIIAQTSEKEGVLLIGETIEGWELVAVYDQYAEFRTGQRKHILTFDN